MIHSICNQFVHSAPIKVASLQPTHSIHQTLHLLPESFLQHLEEPFNDHIDDNNELLAMIDEIANKQEDFAASEEDRQPKKREQSTIMVDDNTIEDASLNKDKILAYNIYKNQWTSTNKKKTVVDASIALKDYRRKHNLNSARDFSGSNYLDIESSQPYPAVIKPPEQSIPPVLSLKHPSELSLFTLGPDGPGMPFLRTFIEDMRNVLSTPILPRSGSEVMYSIREIMHNMRNHQGDNRFDIYDWLPLFGVLFVSALVFNGLFPNSLFLSGQQLSIGRRKDGRAEDETMLDNALAQLENGVLIMSAIRQGGDCSTRLACKLGDAARDALDDEHMIVEAMNLLLPNKYSNFTTSFRNVIRGEDRSSCSAKCYRCLVI